MDINLIVNLVFIKLKKIIKIKFNFNKLNYTLFFKNIY